MVATIPRVDLTSTSLAAATYDDHHRQLQLDFLDGSQYVFFGVPVELYRHLLCSTSKGSFFNRYIRGHFPYAKLSIEN
jgi:hypothetical protein